MIHRTVKLFGRTLALSILGALLTSVGCDQDVAEISSSELELQQTSWSYCADQGERCEFTGRRRVMYRTNSGAEYVATFSGGVSCRGRSFGVQQQRVTGRCFVAAQTSRGSAGSPAAGSGAHSDHGGAAGSSSSNTAGGAAAGTNGHSNHTSGGAGASAQGTGPYIDASAIPTGSTGMGRVQIESTSEKPGGSDGTGAFRTVCDFSHMSFDDPIVYPGTPGAAHLHAFFGNTETDAHSTTDSLRNTGNSTCRGGIANRSGYWVPALIDPQGRPVKPSSMEVYYKSGYYGVKPGAIQNMPEGLRIIAGNAKSASAQQYAYWGCRENYIGKPGSIPTCPAGDSVALIIEFPQCWDGKNLDSADHASHMAYAQNGCPASHPVAIPAITFNVVYTQPSGGMAGYRLASDMYSSSQPGGFSAHGDWWNGWDPAVSKAFVERCVQPALDCRSHLLGDGRAIY